MGYFLALFRRCLIVTLVLLESISLNAQKSVYIPSFITQTGMDLNDNNSQWSYARSRETENLIIFWEPGFGSDPTLSPAPYKIDMDALIGVSEKSYAFFVDSLEFAIKGSSVTDQYKLMLFLLHTPDWAAFGSGQDDLVGSLFVSPAAANIKHVVAHEIGHCFQYITGCDSQGGFRYGFGENGEGGNGFWEQCAQWKAYKVFPELQFSHGDFNAYINNNHLHIIHENTRYANYFLPDFWSYKRGIDFMGKLWREALYPEDPIEAYMRLNSINQEEFNNEIYDHAARLTTWDLPALIQYVKESTGKRSQVKMNAMSDEYWQIDSTVCIENYGYNSIQLVPPLSETEVKVTFQGLAGESGFRSINIEQAGWKLGFVALLSDGKRVYSPIGTAKYTNGKNPETQLSFSCPNNCVALWLVVSGAPQDHWRHPWDDDNTNDEQWPYQIKFENTHLIGKLSGPLNDIDFTFDVEMEPRSSYDPDVIVLNTSLIEQAFSLSRTEIIQLLGKEIQYYAINPDMTLDSVSTAFYPGHWFDNEGKVTQWGNNSYIYSELKINDFHVLLGQYPDLCQNGDQYKIQQVLIYKRTENEMARITFTFNVTIREKTSSIQDDLSHQSLKIYPNPTSNNLFFSKKGHYTLFDMKGAQLDSGYGNNIDLSQYLQGVYLLILEGETFKVIRR